MPRHNGTKGAIFSNPLSRIGGHGLFLNNFNVETQTPYSNVTDSLTAVTLECWFYYQTATALSTLICGRGFDQAIALEVTSTGVFQFQLSTSVTANVFAGTGTLPIGRWSHLAGTYDGTTQNTWINGISGGSVGHTGTVPVLTASNRCFDIGGAFATLGILQEIRLSNIARYSSTFTPSYGPFTSDSNTLMLYHLSEGVGTTLVDSGPNRLHGSILSTSSFLPTPSWTRGNF